MAKHATKTQVLNRGYITHALVEYQADNTSKIIGMTTEWQDCQYAAERLGSKFYWSEVYVEPNYMSVIIRKGVSLAHISQEIGTALIKQSIANLIGKRVMVTDEEQEIINRYGNE